MSPTPAPEFLDRPGALGALMDIYARAAWELAETLRAMSDRQFESPCNPDPELATPRAVIEHVIGSGYSYALYVRAALGRPAERPKSHIDSVAGALRALDELVMFTEASLEPDWRRPEGELDGLVIESRWGVRYDLEQMLEHAVTHIERHRRQLLKMLRKAPEPGS